MQLVEPASRDPSIGVGGARIRRASKPWARAECAIDSPAHNQMSSLLTPLIMRPAGLKRKCFSEVVSKLHKCGGQSFSV